MAGAHRGVSASRRGLIRGGDAHRDRARPHRGADLKHRRVESPEEAGGDAPATEKTSLTGCWAASGRVTIETISLKPASSMPAAKVPSPWSCDGATSPHFQTDVEEKSLTIDTEVRWVGRSKEHRVDPQIQVGPS